MADDQLDADQIIEPTEQRSVALLDADEVLAARADADIYLPIRPICAALGLSYSPQLRRIRHDEVLAESTQSLRLQTRGGPQVMLCMDLEAVPLWLAGIEASRVRQDLRERLLLYKRWVRKVVYDAFARETGIESAVGGSRAPMSASADVTALTHIAQMAEAIATMARQQIAFEQHSDTQAAEISTLVKAIATEMAAREGRTVGTGKGRNPYQAVFGELYRRFRVSSYHNIPLRRFGEVMTWLREYQDTLDAHGEGGSAPG